MRYHLFSLYLRKKNQIGSVSFKKESFLWLHSATSLFEDSSKSFNVSNKKPFFSPFNSYADVLLNTAVMQCNFRASFFFPSKEKLRFGCTGRKCWHLPSRLWILWGVKRIKEKLGQFFMALWKHLNLAIWVPIGGCFYCARYSGESVGVISWWISWSFNTSLQVFLLPDKNKLKFFILKQPDCGLGGFK